MAETSNKIRFVHGTDATYKAAPTTYANDVYFATDTKVIYVQGVAYKGMLGSTVIASSSGLDNLDEDFDEAPLTALANNQIAPKLRGTTTPKDLGTAAVGTSNKYAREDHVHKMPTAAQVGAPTTAQHTALAGRVTENERTIEELIAEDETINNNLDTLFSKINALSGAYIPKGNAPSTEFTAALTNHTAGWSFIVTKDGDYVGEKCQAGDAIFCKTTGTTANNDDWFVLESNMKDAAKNEDGTYSRGIMSAADKKKLDGIATGAEVNQNAYAKVLVGSTTIAADQESDTLTLAAGSNVTLTPDATNDKVTIAAADTHHVAHLYVGADETAASGETTNGYSYLKLFENNTLRDKYGIKGSGSVSVATDTAGNITISGTDTKYTLPTAASGTLGGVKLGYNTTGKNYKLQVDASGNAYVNVPWTDTNTTYSAASSTNLGLVKIGSNITVSSGTISLTSSNVTGALGWTPAKASDLTALQTKVTANTNNIAGHENRIDNVEAQLCWYEAD